MIRKALQWLHSKLTIHETYLFNGTPQELKEILAALSKKKWANGFSTEHLKENKYAMTPVVSWGTLSFGIFASIKIYFEHSPLNDWQQQIKIHTDVRPENWFLLVLFLFIALGFTGFEGDPWMVLTLPGIFLVCFVLFNFVYKIQEESLINKVKKRIRLGAALAVDPS
jgi:hypothetical protein